MSRSQFRRLLAVGCILAVLILVARLIWTGNDTPPSNRPVELPTDGYVGSNSCRSCHQDQHRSWHDSYHRTMTQPATEQSVLGDFNNVKLSGKELDVRLFKQDGQFMAEMNFRHPTVHATYPVVLTTGSHIRQAYWMVNPDDSQLMILPFMYLRAEKRWIPRPSGYLGERSQHQTPEKEIFKGEYGRWSVVCIRCHTTHGQPTPLDETGTPSKMPRVAEFGISCEACHGPGAAHVNAKRNHTEGAGDIVQPAHLAHDRSSQVCGQCHFVFANRSEETFKKWQQIGDFYRPGDDLFADPFRLVVLGRAERMPDRPAHVPDPGMSGSFWSDGMIRATGREFNGLIDSPCYQRGKMSCLSCHQMHQKSSDPRSRSEWAAGQLKPDMNGGRACVQCHDRFNDAAQLKQHTRHLADSSGSNCYNCHMPNTTYGLLKATRSHQIHSPRVADTVKTGRPNACNQCHQDKSLAWTANQLADWYNQPKPKLSADDEQISASVRWALSGDAGQRAITAWTFGWSEAYQSSGNNWQAPYLAQLLDDPYDAVRFIAHRSLKRLPGFADFDYDFIGPPEQRSGAVQRARKVWEQSNNSVKRPFARQTLIDPKGQILEQDFQRLLRDRDDRPVEISE